MRALLVGANGQLGSDLLGLLASYGETVLPLTHQQLEVRDREQVLQVVTSNRPDVVINTSAFHKVEECEKNPQMALEVNAIGLVNLAHACRDLGAILVHFSTDYVFDGKRRMPYTESDLPLPLNIYGTSKLTGEHLLACCMERYFIIRTCGLYGRAGSSGKGGNFVENMLKKATAGEVIRVVNDQVLTPTYTRDLALAVRSLVLTGEFGLYHVTADGECSWYEFARRIFELEMRDVQLTPVSSSEFPSPVKRPAYSVLSKEKARSLGISMPPWDDALQRYLRERPTHPSPVTVHASA